MLNKNNMKVIFLQNVRKVGVKDEVKDVNEGYARNFLIPQKLAVEASPKALSVLNKKLGEKAHRVEKENNQFNDVVTTLEEFILVIKRKANAEGHLFSSVTVKDIINELEKNNLTLSEKDLDIKNPIKTLGKFEIPILKTNNKTLSISVEKE